MSDDRRNQANQRYDDKDMSTAQDKPRMLSIDLFNYLNVLFMEHLLLRSISATCQTLDASRKVTIES
jgi:hypothetical protein